MPTFYEQEELIRLQKMELEILSDFMQVCDENKLEYFGIAGTGIGALRHRGFIPWDDDIDVALPRKDFDRMLSLIKERYGDKYTVLNAKEESRFPMMTTRLCRNGTVFIEEALKGAECPCGIFLDLYVLDNVADNRIACELQSWSAWFWSKLLVLRCMPKPFLFQTGWKAELIWRICAAVHGTMKLLNISPQWLRNHCENVCRRYEHKKTKRMAFLPDTSPYWNVINKEKLYPLRKLDFETVKLNFPNNIEEILTDMYGDYMQLPPVEKRKTHYPYRMEFESNSTAV